MVRRGVHQHSSRSTMATFREGYLIAQGWCIGCNGEELSMGGPGRLSLMCQLSERTC